MPDYIKRPTFYEGQIISAADLNLTVSHDRDEWSRHLRHQHSWGIVSGLELTGADRTTSGASGTQKPFKEVEVGVGLAVDGTGRTIVVTEPTRVPEDLFSDLGVAISDPAAWYPVFLQGRDTPTQETATTSNGCATAAPNRVTEIYEITFGRLTELASLDAQQDVEIIDGPGGGTTGTPWKVLLGFVQWDESIAKFTAVGDSADGVARRYSGVRAGDVMGAGGSLTLRSGERSADGAPALQITSGDKGELHFGTQNAAGEITPVMTVNTDGNLTVTGKIVGALAGGVQIESGVASDGMLLPLPANITQEQIDDGEVVIQTHVTPRMQIPARFAAAEKWFPHFYECRVDARRVRCRVRYIATAVAGSEDWPGVCDYVVMAFPGADGGA